MTYNSINTNGQITFQSHVILDNTMAANGAKSVHASDLDGDGDLDVLSASSLDKKIAWYENEDGQGNFGLQKIISLEVPGAQSVFAGDLDGDGDADVLAAGSNALPTWYENLDGLGNFGEQNFISTVAEPMIDIFAADLDGDGDLDVLSVSEVNLDDDKIVWYENTDGLGNFGPQQIIDIAFSPRAVKAADLDGDGDLDVFIAELNSDKIAWYENTDGLGSFGPQQVVSNNAVGAQSVSASDFDGDGDLDLLSASFSDDKIAWYENVDGLGSFGSQRIISENTLGARSAFAGDLDGDGDMDVLSASSTDDKIAWYENTDGQGSFGSQQIISTQGDQTRFIYAADLDGDGSPDVLSASFADSKIAWYKNTNGLGDFGQEQIVTYNMVAEANTIYTSDLDGDGDQDVLTTARFNNQLAWYENTDGSGSFGPQQVITVLVDESANSVLTGDLDDDGDQDVLFAYNGYDGNGKIAWLENMDGQGTFSDQHIVTTNVQSVWSLFIADLDGDDRLDILSASYQDNKIAWYKNSDGQGTFGDQQIITIDSQEPLSIFASDLDGDGDLDVLSASAFDDKISWYENIDGLGSFEEQILTTNIDGASIVYACDIDLDDDQDIVGASHFSDGIFWFENMDGQGTFGEAQAIPTTEGNVVYSASTVDLDNDGDQDIVYGSDHFIAWSENTDGLGTFGEQQILNDSYTQTFGVTASDLDGDGDQDIASVSFEDHTVAWHERIGAVNIIEKELLDFTIYPVPVSDFLKIEVPSGVNRIDIYNSLGQLVKTSSTESILSVEALTSGIYFCKLTLQSGVYGIQKFIKE